MKRPLYKRVPLVLILAGSFLSGAIAATIAQDTTLIKPFNEYVINDVFPKATNENFAETGRRWRQAAEDLTRDAESRQRAVEGALEAKKQELKITKIELKDAKRDKDLVRIGMLEGIVRNEELSIDILNRLRRVAEKQRDVARAWGDSGEAIERFTSADNDFDTFRNRRLTRPESGEIDQRLGADGYDAFRAHAQAMEDLGEAFSTLGSRTESLAEERMKVLETLAKGGHVQSAR